MLEVFPNPLSIGKFPSLIFALIADGICSILIILGLFTRISTMLIFINLLVALIIIHQANFTEIHGELAAIYLMITLILFCYGPGNMSLDKAISDYKN